jgi:hypothetical protein
MAILFHKVIFGHVEEARTKYTVSATLMNFLLGCLEGTEDGLGSARSCRQLLQLGINMLVCFSLHTSNMERFNSL